jgi:hypothetical protein
VLHVYLQAENNWLRWQHQLIAELCKGFDWFRNLKLHSLLADSQLMQMGEQLTPECLQQQLSSNCLATDDEVRLLQQLPALPDLQGTLQHGGCCWPGIRWHKSLAGTQQQQQLRCL